MNMDRYAADGFLVRGLLVFALVWITGCGSRGPERMEVSGMVLVNGEPLKEGILTLIPSGTTTGPSAGAAIQNGSYTIAASGGPVVGMHRVEIKAMRATGRQIELGTPHPEGTTAEEIVQFIPPQYNTDSTLSVEIKPGPNHDVDFRLEIPGLQ